MNNTELYNVAAHYLGVQEWAGKDSNNPVVLDFYKQAGHPEVKTDEVPWCAAFVNSVLHDCGIKGTGALNARSFMKWGKEVPSHRINLGDIIVFWRESPTSWKGHVAFFAGYDAEGNILSLGGNQGDAVSIKSYDKSKLLTVRRP